MYTQYWNLSNKELVSIGRDSNHDLTRELAARVEALLTELNLAIERENYECGYGTRIVR